MNLSRPVKQQYPHLASVPQRSTLRRGWRQVSAALVILLAAVAAFGQETRSNSENPDLGSICGTLTTTQDNSSSGVAGVSVKLTPLPSHGDSLIVDTDEAGRYEFRGLRSGNYAISISLPGFKSLAKSISLGTGQAAVQDITLELEMVTEKVEVSEQTQAIETESSSAPAATLTDRQLVALPTATKDQRSASAHSRRGSNARWETELQGRGRNQSLMLVNPRGPRIP